MDSSHYEYQPSFILGFHGCDIAVGESLLAGMSKHLKPSQRNWDWLGAGIYFWEGNPSRALDWANSRKREGKIDTPFVLGAIIDLRHCLDLFDLSALRQVELAHSRLENMMQMAGTPMLENKGSTPDKAGRQLDCAVMNTLHAARKEGGLEAYDSVRGPFLEGEPVYAGAGFRSLSHIQICVRSTACIKGYFRPILLVCLRR